MKPRVLIGVFFIIGFTSLLMWNFGNSIGSFVTFEEAEYKGVRVHVAGTWDQTRPSGFDNQRMIFTFYMTDNNGETRRVHFNKPKPNNFEDADGLVVMGKMRNGVFFSDDMLVKCPSKYNDASNLEVSQAPHSF